MKAIFIILLWFSAICTMAQNQFTPNDELQGLLKSYKPSYSPDLPEWAKMLYQPKVNFTEVSAAFELYMDENPGKESAIIRYFRIWSRAVEPYVLEDGTIQLPDLNKEYEELRNMQAETFLNPIKNPVSNSNWSFVGPKETFWLNESGSTTAPGSCPWQVNVYSFDIAPSDNTVIFCGTETGFVNKTTNKGQNWSLVAPGYFFVGSVTAIAIHPSNPDIVYAAAGNQVHKTTNGGISWTPMLPTGNLFYADRLKIDPNNPQKLYAASSNGLYTSSDAGVTWTQKWNAPAYDVEIKPNDDTQIFALTKANGKFSVVQSTDGGQTFTAQSTFPTNVTESSGGLLAMTTANPNLMFAICLSANNTPYLLKGTFSGGIWSWALQATGQTTVFPMDNGQGYFDLAMEVSPVNQNIILVGTTTLFKSVNGGATFTPIGGYYGNFNIHPDIQDIKMLSNGESWVSTDGGMNLTTDNFTLAANYFVKVNGIIGSDLWGFDQGWNEDIMVGGRYHNGNTAIASFYQPKALRMGGAESPTGWVLQGKSRHVAFNDLGNGWILPQTAEGQPEGRFIFSKYPNMDEYGGRRGNMVFHPNYYGTVYLGEGTGFWRSKDMGVTWDLLYNFPAEVRYLQISYSNPNVIYADLVYGGLVKSTDGGITWVSKPTLTASPYGNSNWKGKLFFAISPYNENVIYACLQNGTWSSDLGKVFKSSDGGDTWSDLSGSVNDYLKCIVIQPTDAQQDLVYLFTIARSGKTSKVYYRKEGMTDWADYSTNYPTGISVNMALPFFKEGKLREGGNAGVWESPMQEPAFTPVINPWIEKSNYDCMTDTLYFDDHSILNHSGVSWHWEINPAPAYIENPDIRNPSVVLGSPGTYDVTLKVTQNGQTYTKFIQGMVSTTTCPSIYDCDHPADIPKDNWSLIYVDSQETGDPGLATMSFDNDPTTIWHTRWSSGTDPYPHEIRIALGNSYRISNFTYLPRQEGENGRIKSYQLYISEDSLNWGLPVKTGQWINTAAPETVILDSTKLGRYFRLVALSEVNGGPWASAAEFKLTGCIDFPTGNRPPTNDLSIKAFPVPTSGIVKVDFPGKGGFSYVVINSSGKQVDHGTIAHSSASYSFDLGYLKPGLYFIMLTENKGAVYRVKIIRD